MNKNDEKLVDFYMYCQKCKHSYKDEDDMPCRECLEYPTNVNSAKPVRYEEKEEEVK